MHETLFFEFPICKTFLLWKGIKPLLWANVANVLGIWTDSTGECWKFWIIGDYSFALWSFSLYFSVFYIIHRFFLSLHVFFVLRLTLCKEVENLRFWIFNRRVLFNPILGFQVHLFSSGLACEYSEERGSQASSGFTFYLTLQSSDRIKFIMPGKFYCSLWFDQRMAGINYWMYRAMCVFAVK